MATYNGARYLGMQLESLAGQNRLPDELVVVDDGSTDNTRAILEEFAGQAPFPVRIIQHELNRGVVASFGEAIGACQGELIALCDQDDRWYPEKLERIEAVASELPAARLVVTNAHLIRGDGSSMAHNVWDEKGLNGEVKRSLAGGSGFSFLLKKSMVTGCTLAIRKEALSLVLPIPEPGPWLHDAWIALLLSAMGPVGLIPEPLMDYRHHGEQYTESFKSDLDFRARELQGLEHQVSEALKRLESLPQTEAVLTNLAILREKRRHLRVRLNLPRTKGVRLWPIGVELLRGGYSRNSNGIRSAGADLLT